MTALLAAAPILLILVLMIGLRWPASRAGPAGLIVALPLAVLVFGLGRRVLPELGPIAAAGGALAEASFTAATILWILLPALSIHNLQIRTGAVEALRLSIGRLTGDPRILAVLIGWFFALFMEGAAGFGTPIALAAPFLVSVGFRPTEALACTLIGHSVGVSFGAVGTPVQPQVAVTAFGARELASATGLYHSLLGWVMLLFLWRIAARSSATGTALGDDAGRRPDAGAARPPNAAKHPSVLVWVLLAAVCVLLPYFALSRFVGPELPTLGGALIGSVIFVAMLHRYGPARNPAARAEERRSGGSSLLRASAPYLGLILVILATRLVPAARTLVSGIQWEWSAFDVFHGSFQPLYHPGTMLWIGFAAGAVVQGARPSSVAHAVARAARQLVPVTIALLAMLGLARLLVHAGMIGALAEFAASTVGGLWPLAAPFVGVLGTFVTGSATASNILLTDFQDVTARSLGLPVLPLLGAQGFGAAVGNIICPHNIVAGAAAVGLRGGEGEVLRRTFVPCMVYAALGGVLAMLLVR